MLVFFCTSSLRKVDRHIEKTLFCCRIQIIERLCFFFSGLPARFRHPVRGVQPIRGGRGGVGPREHIPPKVFHLREVQVSNELVTVVCYNFYGNTKSIFIAYNFSQSNRVS